MGNDHQHVTMADPEGNEFDVCWSDHDDHRRQPRGPAHRLGSLSCTGSLPKPPFAYRVPPSNDWNEDCRVFNVPSEPDHSARDQFTVVQAGWVW